MIDKCRKKHFDSAENFYENFRYLSVTENVTQKRHSNVSLKNTDGTFPGKRFRL